MGFTPRRRRRDGALELPRRPAGACGGRRRLASRERGRRHGRAAARLRQLPPADAAPGAGRPLRAPRRARPLPHLRPGLVRRLGDGAADRPRAARADRRRWPSARALPHEMLRADPRCPRCAGRLKTVHNQSRWGRSLQLQCERRHGAYQSFAQFLRGEGAAAADVADRSRQAAARPRPDRLPQLRRRDRQGRRALPLVPLDPEPARRRPPRARARSGRHDRAAGVHRDRGAAGRAAVRGLRRGAARRRDDQLLAVRRDARDHEPGRRARPGAGARAGAARGRGAAFARGRQAPPRRARRGPAAPARVGGGDGGRGRRASAAAASTRPTGARSPLAGNPCSPSSRSRSCSGSDGTPAGTEVFLARPAPTRSPQRRARHAPACSRGRRAVIGTLCALGAIALWATLASLGVALAHVPPFLLTGLALRRRQRAVVAAGAPMAGSGVDARCSASTACSASTSCSSSRCAPRRRSRPTSSTTSGRC